MSSKPAPTAIVDGNRLTMPVRDFGGTSQWKIGYREQSSWLSGL